MSFRERLKTGDINSPWSEILDNKLIFHRELTVHQAPLPDLFAVIHNGRVTGVDADVEHATNPGRWVVEKVTREGRLVLKPVKGSTGTDIYFLEATDSADAIAMNGVQTPTNEVIDFVSSLDDYLVSSYITQSAWLNEIYPHALNTMRVLTMWDDKKEDAFIARAILRIGTDESRPVDNFSKGGLSVAVDLDTGELGSAVKLDSSGLVQYSTHPDTGAEIEGRSIEEWEQIRETVLETAKSVSFVEYVGWDITVDSTGEPVLIEGNNSSDVDLLQVHGPLLNDDRVRRFYERYDVIE
jgi:3D (Asp-Asp-Asp) domain-containing protein